MPINSTFYGTVLEAADYFGNRLHETAWSDATADERVRALVAATRVIDTLNYKGYKKPVYDLLQTFGLVDIPLVAVQGSPSQQQIETAEKSQALEFPRGTDTDVPEAIRVACYEIAHSLLDGKDPEHELENLGVSSHGYSSLRTTYSRGQVPIEHIINGVPNAQAWRLIRPFLRDGDQIRLTRVS